MNLTLTQALETSWALQERLASTPTEKRAELEQKVAMVNFAAFGMFKRAWAERIGPALSAAAHSPLGKGLQWGAGLGVPAVGAAHLMGRDARHQGEELIDHARNQALLTALGVGGIKSVGQTLGGVGRGVGSALGEAAAARRTAPAPAAEAPLPAPQSWDNYQGLEGLSLEDLQELEGLKTSSDSTLQKIAAVVLLDDVLEQQLSKLAGTEQADALECLMLNRSHGTHLLRELL